MINKLENNNSLIMLVDDNIENINLVSEFLWDFDIISATSGEESLELLKINPGVDIILLDVNMPDMSGYDVIKFLKSNPDTIDIPVIFVTGLADADEETYGLELGAADYIKKPINYDVLRARMNTHLELKHSKEMLFKINKDLTKEVNYKTREVKEIREVSLKTLSSLAKTRDNETGNHILRTQGYVRILGDYLVKNGYNETGKNSLEEERLLSIVESAPLHDIGKVGIPDYILLKPGKLTKDEWKIMKTHAQAGADALSECLTDDLLKSTIKFLETAIEIAGCHHERWNGEGYPNGLSGTDIPISARLMMIADVFDALISKRCYKEGMTYDQASKIINDDNGSFFDPLLVNAFNNLTEDFKVLVRLQD